MRTDSSRSLISLSPIPAQRCDRGAVREWVFCRRICVSFVLIINIFARWPTDRAHMQIIGDGENNPDN